MKDLKYFMALPYLIEIQPISARKGGGYDASIPLLGKRSVCGYGETIDEALKNLQQVKEERLGEYLEEGLDIPEPDEEEDSYSGKFIVRIPKSLHKELTQRAKKNEVSLNHYTSFLLTRGLQEEKTEAAMRGVRIALQTLRRDLAVLKYNIDVHVAKPPPLFGILGIEDEENRAA